MLGLTICTLLGPTPGPKRRGPRPAAKALQTSSHLPCSPSQVLGLPSQSFHSRPLPVAPTAPWGLCPAGPALSVSSISGGPVAGAEAGERRIRAGNCRVKMTAQRLTTPNWASAYQEAAGGRNQYRPRGGIIREKRGLERSIRV